TRRTPRSTGPSSANGELPFGGWTKRGEYAAASMRLRVAARDHARASQRPQCALAPLVLLGQPLPQRLEVVGHRARREIVARLLQQQRAPVAGRSDLHDRLEEVADIAPAEVVGPVRILVEDLACDVIVQLEQ